eukprot:g1924.t1
MQGSQKVQLIRGVLRVPSNVPEKEKDFLTKCSIGIVVWFAVSFILGGINTLNRGSGVFEWLEVVFYLAVSAACCFCFIEGINDQNKTLVSVFSVCNVLSFVLNTVGVILTISRNVVDPGSVVWGLIGASVAFAMALSGFKVASYNIIFTKEIHPQPQIGSVATQPVIVQPRFIQPTSITVVSEITNNNAQQQQGAANIQMVQQQP